MKRIKVILPILFAALFIFTQGGCGDVKAGASEGKKEKQTVTFFAMDTVMDVLIYGDKEVLKEAEALVKELESRFSVTMENSDLYQLNKSKKTRVAEETYALFKRGLEICERTGGVLDLTIYPVVKAWGFTTQDYRVPGDEELAGLLKNVDYRKLELEEDRFVSLQDGMMADLGSVAKGYTGDRLIELFKFRGITSALINLGGNVQALGSKPDGSAWKVAIADPNGSSDYAGVVSVIGKTVITSGAYERFFEEKGKTYHHIIDTSTGWPAESGFVSVSVIGEEGTLCDGLSTSLFAMGPEKAFEFWKNSNDFEAVFITAEDRIYVTEGVKDDFTPLGRYKNVTPEVICHDQD